jgi:hypothetical protein
MESDASRAGERPRPWLLIALGAAVVALVAFWMWPAPSGAPAVAASTQARAAQRRAEEQGNPLDLDVRLESLNTARPEAGTVERNLFRFEAVRLPPAPAEGGGRRESRPEPVAPPPPPPGPPPPPPIPLKFIGIVEKQGLKVAALSDCRMTFFGSEGQIIDGRYRLVRIGVESMVIERLEGGTQTTVRLEGCPAR